MTRIRQLTGMVTRWRRLRFQRALIPALVIMMGCFTVQAEGVERVCLSLRVLSTTVSKALAESSSLPTECKSLAGIGFLEGFIVDDATGKDVILVGLRSASRPSLRLDDLVVNARSIWRSGTYPYCSLDPRREDVCALRDFLRDSGVVTRPAEMEAFFQRLKSKVGNQIVDVGGVPRNSRHAHVMIGADYHMKQASQGHVSLPGVVSYLDRSLAEAKSFVLEQHVLPTTGVSMARFWFHVGRGSPSFQEGEGIVWLDECGVVVLTEAQMATDDGQLYDVEREDATATAFADNLTAAFVDLTGTVPVYADLENLFRLRALLLAMDHRRALSLLGEGFNSFLGEYEYEDETPMDPSRPGLANYRKWSYSFSSGNMIYEYHLFPLVCGGVGMDMEVDHTSFDDRESRRLFSMRSTALAARPSRGSLSWVVPTR